jgi:hypothetical protein
MSTLERPDRGDAPRADHEDANFPDYDDAFLAMVNDMDVVPEDTEVDKHCASCGHTWTEDTVWCPECQRKRERPEDVRGADVGALDIADAWIGDEPRYTLDEDRE